MSSDARSALEQLRRMAATGELSDVCRSLGIRLLTAFGSAVAPGEAAPADLDLAALLEPDRDVVDALTALIRLLGYDGVDLMDLSRAGLVARAAAYEGEPLHEDEPGLYARSQMATLPLVAETDWIRRLQLEQLAS